MADPLTQLPHPQRLAFCRLLCADQIEKWMVWGDDPAQSRVIVVHSKFPACEILPDGEVKALARVGDCAPTTKPHLRVVE